MKNVGLSITKMAIPEVVTLSKQILATIESGKVVVEAKVKEAAEYLVFVVSQFNPGEQSTYIERRAVDHAVDTIFSAAYNLFKCYEKFYSKTLIPLTEKDESNKEATAVILSKLFPSRTGFLKETWARQYGAMSMIVEHVPELEIQSAIETLGAEDIFERLIKAHHIYGVYMGFTGVQEGDQKPSEILKEWYDAFEYYLVTVLFFYKDDLVTKAKLEEPYIQMTESIRATRKRKNKTPDPETTEENPIVDSEL